MLGRDCAGDAGRQLVGPTGSRCSTSAGRRPWSDQSTSSTTTSSPRMMVDLHRALVGADGCRPHVGAGHRRRIEELGLGQRGAVRLPGHLTIIAVRRGIGLDRWGEDSTAVIQCHEHSERALGAGGTEAAGISAERRGGDHVAELELDVVGPAGVIWPSSAYRGARVTSPAGSCRTLLEHHQPPVELVHPGHERR